MAKRDYYEVLGVKRGVDDASLKKAYREKAKQYHPDRNKDDNTAEAKFKEVQEAYEVLRDPKKRQMYDQFGHEGFGQGTHAGEWRSAPGGQRVYTWPGGGTGAGGFGDLEELLRGFGMGGGVHGGGGFSDFFQQGAGPRRRQTRTAPAPDLDLKTDINITFEQAIHGTEIELQLTDGSGSKQSLSVKVPAGVNEEQTIRLRGQGSHGPGNQRGDVLIRVHVSPHRYFTRTGDDIELDLPISVTEAMLGAKVDLPTLDGMTTVTIPPGTAGGSKLRLKDKGLMNQKTKQRGHQYLLINIVPPKKLSESQQSLVQQLAETLQDNPRKSTGWQESA